MRPGHGPAPAYARAGVSLEAGAEVVAGLRAAVESTHHARVRSRSGGFAGLFELDGRLLAATTDGVGTKALLAARWRRFRGLGHDVVNHAVNDLLCQGARPLFFLDYLAFGRLEPQAAVEIVEGMAEACRAAGMALVGGETAEMPDTYLPGALDVVGTAVGLVPPGGELGPERVEAGQLLVGLPSSGLHTNGFSLVRRIFAERDPEERLAGLPGTLAEELLRPHRSYLGQPPAGARALAHVTGGGLVENLARVLPPGLSARVHLGRWRPPPIFGLIQELGGLSREEMYRVFNMGIGLVAVVPPGEEGEGLVIGQVASGGQRSVLLLDSPPGR